MEREEDLSRAERPEDSFNQTPETEPATDTASAADLGPPAFEDSLPAESAPIDVGSWPETLVADTSIADTNVSDAGATVTHATIDDAEAAIAPPLDASIAQTPSDETFINAATFELQTAGPAIVPMPTISSSRDIDPGFYPFRRPRDEAGTADRDPASQDVLLEPVPLPQTPGTDTGNVGRDSATGHGATPEPIGKPLPRVMVMVTLADAQASILELLSADGDRMAARLHQIAKSEIQQELWWQKCQQNAMHVGLPGRR